MNKILNNFSLAGDKFMPQMDLRQKNKERIKKKKRNKRFTIYLSKWPR